MKNKFYFQIFTSQSNGPIGLQLKSIESQIILWAFEESLPYTGLLQSRVYMSDISNQMNEVKRSSLYKDCLSHGAISYIEQPLLCGEKVAVQVWFSSNPDLVKEGSPDCFTFSDQGATFIYHSVRFAKGEVKGMDAAQQTKLAFERHIDLLKERGMSLEHNCHRTWIYVRDIDRNYTGVVKGRNEIFRKHGLTADTHYISSTGIGGFSENHEAIVCVDFLSIQGVDTDRVSYLQALDYLNPTHEYGVAFERGTKIKLSDESLYFISGTASIDKKGKCVHRGDVLTQTGRLFLNIEKLLENGGASLSDIQYMIVYLRDISDYASVNRYLRLRFPGIPFLITEARVCRPEWLIEVECVAQRPE